MSWCVYMIELLQYFMVITLRNVLFPADTHSHRMYDFGWVVFECVNGSMCCIWLIVVLLSFMGCRLQWYNAWWVITTRLLMVGVSLKNMVFAEYSWIFEYWKVIRESTFGFYFRILPYHYEDLTYVSLISALLSCFLF